MRNVSVGICLVGLSLAGAYALSQERPTYRVQQRGRSPMDATVRGQVVFTFDHRENIQGVDVDVMTVKPQQSVVMGLIPLDRQAPLPTASWVLCTSYTEKIGVRLVDGLESNDVNEIAFNCGGKRYLFAKLDIQ